MEDGSDLSCALHLVICFPCQGKSIGDAKGETFGTRTLEGGGAPHTVLPGEILPDEILPDEILPDEILPDEMLPHECFPTRCFPPGCFPTRQVHACIGPRHL